MSCNLCDYRTMVNEAREEGAETWLAEQEPYGFNLFVVPKGASPDFRLRRDNVYGPQRRAWFNTVPEKCECGERVKLEHEASTWKPDAAAVAHSLEVVDEPPPPQPEEPEPKKLRRPKEVAVELNLL